MYTIIIIFNNFVKYNTYLSLCIYIITMHVIYLIVSYSNIMICLLRILFNVVQCIFISLLLVTGISTSVYIYII